MKNMEQGEGLEMKYWFYEKKKKSEVLV